MDEEGCLKEMVPPGRTRQGKPYGGVIQVHVTRACDKRCCHCTQGSQLQGRVEFMTPLNFAVAVDSLYDYFGVVGVFGGNPALHPEFPELCRILRGSATPKGRRGLWCNRPFGHAAVMRETFDPGISNLNVHRDRAAWDEFKAGWPESRPFGLDGDSRHSPVHLSMRDLGIPEPERHARIARCDINQHWSAMIAQIGGELRGYFCEVAGGQAVLRGDPTTGVEIRPGWWKAPMTDFVLQVRRHCHDCGFPLKAYGALAVAGTSEVTSAHWADVYRVKGDRPVEVVTQVGVDRLRRNTDYLGNAGR